MEKIFKISCDALHSSKGWKRIRRFIPSITTRPLCRWQASTRKQIGKSCHPTLVFSEAKNSCVDCHTDLHNQTVGPDCARLPHSKSWIVDNVKRNAQEKPVSPDRSSLYSSMLRIHPSVLPSEVNLSACKCIDCHRTVIIIPPAQIMQRLVFQPNCTECHAVNSMNWGCCKH